MARVRDSGMPHQEMWESFFDACGILDALECRAVSGDAVEFGCGYGTFTLPAARRVSGTVYALDIEHSMVVATRERATRAGLSNVVAEQRDFVVQGSGRPGHSVQYAMLFNILHLEQPLPLLREAQRILVPGGKLAILHWHRDAATPRGPPLAIRPSPADCRSWAQAEDLRWIAEPELPGSPWHWGMIFQRR
jgi:ubiquinone/menaquinone biosynthesis C-methylase UbiE